MEIVKIFPKKTVDNTCLMYFSSYSLIYLKYVSTTRKYEHIPEISAQICVYQLTGYNQCKNQIFLYVATVRKEDLKSRIFCPKNSQLCYVMMTKHIFAFCIGTSSHISILS